VTVAEYQAVLTQVGSIAAERDWVTVKDFIVSLSASDDILLLEAEGIDAGELADSIAATSTGFTVTIGSLEDSADNPGASLYADRVVVAFRCGEFLTYGGIEAAQQLMLRPPESYVIVFLGAELIRSPDDLNLIERGIWQSLAGDPDVRWAGQDLAERRCLLWGTTEPGSFTAERIARERGAFERWLRTPLAVSDTLEAQRADYALRLAERETALAAEAAAVYRTQDESARLRSTQNSLQELRSRVLKRLDAETAHLDQEITSSLEHLRGRLQHEIRGRIGLRGDGLWSEEELGREIEGVVRRGMDVWLAEILAIIDERWSRPNDATVRLLSEIDWDLINSVSKKLAVTYPDVILGHLRALGDTDLVIDKVRTSTGTPGLPEPDGKATILWVTASGAALAAVAAIVAGPVLIPVATAGAVGAVGGRLVDRHLGARSNHQAAESLARAAVDLAVNGALDAARVQVRGAARSVRLAVLADFRTLDGVLHTAVLRQGVGTAGAQEPLQATGAAGADQARIAELRRRLDAALADLRT